ncbi:hypothetical protein J4466_05390 [Candidatus Pacearchaeota archaeon]|nr:hypothetical protein [Candidatus Pacearchaeota archaeon]
MYNPLTAFVSAYDFLTDKIEKYLTKEEGKLERKTEEHESVSELDKLLKKTRFMNRARLTWITRFYYH